MNLNSYFKWKSIRRVSLRYKWKDKIRIHNFHEILIDTQRCFDCSQIIKILCKFELIIKEVITFQYLLAGFMVGDREATFIMQNTRLHLMPSMNPDGFEDSSEGTCRLGPGRYLELPIYTCFQFKTVK